MSVVRSNEFELVPEYGHHPALQVSTNLSQFKFLLEKRPPEVHFYKANYVRLNDDLMRIDWQCELADIDIDSAVHKFYRMLEPFIDKIPKTVVPSRDYPMYYSHALISLIKKKDHLRRKIKTEVSNLRKSVKTATKACFDNYVKDSEEKIKSNTKYFFAFTKSLKRTNS